MNVIPIGDALYTHTCKGDGCGAEVKGTEGAHAYCALCRRKAGLNAGRPRAIAEGTHTERAEFVKLKARALDRAELAVEREKHAFRKRVAKLQAVVKQARDEHAEAVRNIIVE